MESLFLFSSFASLATFTFCCFAFLPSFIASSYPIFKHSIYPNFTASHLQFVDYNGAFLGSVNGTFMASIIGLSQSPLSYYLSIIHKSTNTIIWTHNPSTPISESSTLLLTINGLFITDASNNLIWSTPPFNSPVRALQLLETGNLILVDNRNVSLWESFNHPTDTIVMGQNLDVGRSLYAPAGPTNLSTGDYRLTLSDKDLIFQWRDQTYWMLSMETNAFKHSNEPLSYMAMNSTGLNLLGDDGSLVFQVNLNFSSFRIAKLGSDGRFRIMSFIGEKWVEEFVGPEEYCRVPSACGQLGLCNIHEASCSCPPGFDRRSDDKVGCVPTDDSLSLPIGCNPSGNLNSTSISYVKLEDWMDYFSNDLAEPVKRSVNLSICQDLCSMNCSCLGFFYGNYSGVCYLLENYLGSIMSKSTREDRIGYIKTSSASSTKNTFTKKEDKFPMVAMVLIPLFGFFFLLTIIGIAILWLRKARPSKLEDAMILDRQNSLSSSSELNIISIPGLPRSTGITKDANGSNGESISTLSLEPGWVYFPAMALEMHNQRRYLELVDQRLEGRVRSEEVEKLLLCPTEVLDDSRIKEHAGIQKIKVITGNSRGSTTSRSD
ncbi:hypothetical protein FEM48_Zijuj06G0179400 [Ziziphus jujuba var. spinosa]|uniref:Bulb-type lectin domain-containing protein n=1 Tax=Ziziphus jujuba var. spinosa TaxID=714518 RepID=A0A978VAS1_ZIZJJ|nr:hypothetical protein FEM48_Zijuj06G0179400 [Ziziphus jujuba var. spinosa]